MLGIKIFTNWNWSEFGFGFYFSKSTCGGGWYVDIFITWINIWIGYEN